MSSQAPRGPRVGPPSPPGDLEAPPRHQSLLRRDQQHGDIPQEEVRIHSPLRGAAVGCDNWVPCAVGRCGSRAAGVFAVAGQWPGGAESA